MVVLVRAGADFDYRATHNDLLEVEWMGGDSEMAEEEYEEVRYRREDLHPESGGLSFEPRIMGAGYTRGVWMSY